MRFTITQLLIVTLLVAILVAWGRSRRREVFLAEAVKLETEQIAVSKAYLKALDPVYSDVLLAHMATLRSVREQLRNDFDQSQRQNISIQPVADALVSIRDVPVLRELEDVEDPITTMLWVTDRQPIYLNYGVSRSSNDTLSSRVPSIDELGPSQMVALAGPYSLKLEPGSHVLRWKFGVSPKETFLLTLSLDDRVLFEVNSQDPSKDLSKSYSRPSAINQFDFKDLRYPAHFLNYSLRVINRDAQAQNGPTRRTNLHFWFSNEDHDWPPFPQSSSDSR